MAIRIFPDGDDLKLEDNTVGATVKLDDLNKGNNSAHHTRHESGGDDEISLAGFPIYASDLEGTLPSHHTTHESGGADEIDLTGLNGSGLTGIASSDDIDELSTVITTIASSATPTPARASTRTVLKITAQAADFELQNPTGTPQEGDLLKVEVTDDGTPRAITYDTDYADGTAERATTTTESTRLVQIFEYDGSNWLCMFSAEDV